MNVQDRRARVIAAIRKLADDLQSNPRGDLALPPPEHVRRHRLDAFAREGISEEEYEACLEEEPSLLELERQAIDEALVGGVDPGPHDAISRESASGQPGNLQKHRAPYPDEVALARISARPEPRPSH